MSLIFSAPSQPELEATLLSDNNIDPNVEDDMLPLPKGMSLDKSVFQVWYSLILWQSEYQTPKTKNMDSSENWEIFCALLKCSSSLNNDYWNNEHIRKLILSKGPIVKILNLYWSGPLKTEQTGGHFDNHWETECHFQTKQTPTVWISNVFGIPSPL